MEYLKYFEKSSFFYCVIFFCSLIFKFIVVLLIDCDVICYIVECVFYSKKSVCIEMIS